jgi:hypothetical protein
MSKEQFIAWWLQTQYGTVEGNDKRINWKSKHSCFMESVPSPFSCGWGKDFPTSLTHDFCFSSKLMSHLVEIIPNFQECFNVISGRIHVVESQLISFSSKVSNNRLSLQYESYEESFQVPTAKIWANCANPMSSAKSFLARNWNGSEGLASKITCLS